MSVSSGMTMMLTGGLLASTALSGPAWAQGGANANANIGLEDIVVTAQRREDNLQRTPIAITALSPAELETRNIQSARDLMQVTPGLQVNTQTAGNSGGSATYFLRGMGQQRSANGTSPAVGIYVDDFYYPSLHGSVFAILDLQQVEVLRGPQGTLFGRNTIGGAIRYTTKKPDFKETTGYVQGTVGSYDRFDLTGSLNVALSDKVAIRMTGGRLRTDGYVHQQNGGKDAGATKTDLVRGQLRVAPTETLEINLAGQYTESEIDGFPYYVPRPVNTSIGLPGAWNRSANGAARPYDDRYASECDYCQAGTNRREMSDGTYKSVTGSIAWTLSDSFSVKSLTGWQKVESSYIKDLDASPLPISDSVSSGTDRAFSQELQLNGDFLDGRLNTVFGGYYYDEKHVDLPPKYGNQTNLGSTIPQALLTGWTKTKAAFFDATFKVTDRFTALGGIRYSVDKKRAIVRSAAGATIATIDDKFPSTTWRAGVQMQWTPQAMTYATISRGFRAGGVGKINNASPILDSFEPETATNYEVGARIDLFDRVLRLNPTLFHTRWKDIQVQRVVPSTGSGGAQIYVDNAASARSQGFELEAQLAATRQLRLFGALSLLDTKYTSIGPISAITLDTKFVRAPKVTYSLGATYDADVGDAIHARATLNWSYQAKQYSAPSVPIQPVIPAYGVLNARVDLSHKDSGLSLGLFVTNLTDKVYYIGGNDYSNAATGTAQYDLGRPREFGATLKFAF
ncbi:TonB-dependent receptor [Sphingobium jiangsuense]|uniref:Iron complex outermembrane receptor protein n=1 Tax=Sphingobium jiangsuense TaxID=870476 RepID=A0A7W6FP99_9SPHN|nr:TonB-dependent receptor [Sphingobium jiangsuense]MBB3925693.1 iron complex outermembrane receptor protein [Sphingobium jiangsuense]GLT00363.1 TonB-dependent receptor [Sphingobium jiangsuense]